MRLKSLEISGFKSFAKKVELSFGSPVTAIVGPNGSGKSNVAEAFRFALGEQSVKSLRGKKGEDLIFAGGKTISRLSRASVKLTFDNSDKSLPIDFPEVTLERVVHRDGINDYFINSSRARLKDITELLAHAHIGSSGHHIISQGEADRILSASAYERRQMIEDALGLKIYHYRKRESERKLEKTLANVKEVESLRREVAPHLSYLKKQVEKIEKARELKEKLAVEYREYLYRESIYIESVKKILETEKVAPHEKLKELKVALASAENKIKKSENLIQKENEISKVKENISGFMREKDALMREMGRLEGEISIIERLNDERKRNAEINKHALKNSAVEGNKLVDFTKVKNFSAELESFIHDLEGDINSGKDISILIKSVALIREKIKTFIHKIDEDLGEKDVLLDNQENITSASENSIDESSVASDKHLKERLINLENNLKNLDGNLNNLGTILVSLEKEIADLKEGTRAGEREVFEIKVAENEAISALSRIKLKEERLQIEDSDFKSHSREALNLLGNMVGDLANFSIEQDGKILNNDEARSAIMSEDRHVQEERKRKIERTKTRLEDAGFGEGGDVLKEYNDTLKRDEFLKKELADLEIAQASLGKLIAELEGELKERFNNGIDKISSKFHEFFTLMFGGGEAKLDLIKEEKRVVDLVGESDEIPSGGDDEDIKEEIGVEVHVSLPHKKVKGLTMLSGGERALTSIALLFALSQVNPPPFIILDETDAALDEANSRKYGDMIESLSKGSQLILITHNRETMSRAGILYGVTMAREGHSTLLSIKFDEAVMVAK